MIFVAMLFISGGYAILYWAANNLKHWQGVDPGLTNAVPLSVLFGAVTNAGLQKMKASDQFPLHNVPFPYKATPTTGNTTATSNTAPSSPGAAISPNYPGGSATIPTPGIPGTGTIV